MLRHGGRQGGREGGRQRDGRAWGEMRGSGLVSPERGRREPNQQQSVSQQQHPAISPILYIGPSQPSLSKLANLLFFPRLCSRPLLRTNLKLLPTRASCSYFSTFLSKPRTGQAPPRHQFQRPRPIITSIAGQIRFCSVESNTSFAIMASDRDVLPSE